MGTPLPRKDDWFRVDHGSINNMDDSASDSKGSTAQLSQIKSDVSASSTP